MKKNCSHILVLAATSLFLAGCLPGSTKDKGQDKGNLGNLGISFLPAKSCKAPNTLLPVLMEQELLYLQANATDRKALLKEADDIPEIKAILLSSAGEKTSNLKKSQSILKKISAKPKKNCDTDHFLYLRFRQLESELKLRNRLATTYSALTQSGNQVETLKKQIKELTEIETSITRQRKGN